MNLKHLISVAIVFLLLASAFIFIRIFPQIVSFLAFVYNVMLPFIVAVFLAFILHPVVDKLERRRVHRGVAVFIVFSVTAYIFIYGIISLSPMISAQLADITKSLPGLIDQLDGVIKSIADIVMPGEEVTSETIADFIVNNVITVNQILANFLRILYESLGIIFLTPIITFFLLYDYHNIKRKLRNALRVKEVDLISDFIDDIEKAVGAYFRGVVFVMIIMSVVGSIVFAMIGLEYPILFGVVVGVTNIVPIIGPYIGGAFVGVFALTQSISLFVTVVIIIVVMQILESNILTPYIQSKLISAHPLLILISFIVFGSLFGFVGMILSVPLLSIVINIIKYYRVYKKRGNLRSIKRP